LLPDHPVNGFTAAISWFRCPLRYLCFPAADCS
jgi:hypothetical protein